MRVDLIGVWENICIRRKSSGILNCLCHSESICSNILFIRLFHVLKFYIFLHKLYTSSFELSSNQIWTYIFLSPIDLKKHFIWGRESEYSSSFLDGYGAYGLCTEAVDLFVYFDAFDRRILCIWRALYQWPISVQASNIARRVRCITDTFHQFECNDMERE